VKCNAPVPPKERTPAEHRAIVGELRKTTPTTDSEIFRSAPRKRNQRPRHSALAEQFSSLLKWSRLAKPLAALETNWRLPGDYSDDLDDEEAATRAPRYSVECELEMRPTVNELVAAVKHVAFQTGMFGEKVPVGGDVEYVKGPRPRKPLSGSGRTMVRLGALRFAPEDHNERLSPTRGGLVSFGASAFNRGREPYENFGTPYGAKAHPNDIALSNAHFASLMGAPPARHIKPTRKHWAPRARKPAVFPPLPPPTMPFDQAREMCGLPSVILDERPALPCATEHVAESFIGGRVTSSPLPQERSATACDLLERKEQTLLLRGRLSAGNVQVLDIASYCANFTELGLALGHIGAKNAERQGKHRLLKAIYELETVLDAKQL
jgi:hypothetical protein